MVRKNIKVQYTAIELYPVQDEIIQQLNYAQFLGDESTTIFNKLHEADWNSEIKISSHFHLTKMNADFNDYHFTGKYNLIFFDAFAPEKQPSLWSFDNFTKIYEAMDKHGVLTTYSSKGLVKQNIRKAGFQLERLPGPEGKRHMLRAKK